MFGEAAACPKGCVTVGLCGVIAYLLLTGTTCASLRLSTNGIHNTRPRPFQARQGDWESAKVSCGPVTNPRQGPRHRCEASQKLDRAHPPLAPAGPQGFFSFSSRGQGSLHDDLCSGQVRPRPCGLCRKWDFLCFLLEEQSPDHFHRCRAFRILGRRRLREASRLQRKS